MGLADCITEITSWSVTGVNANFGLDHGGNVLGEDLPCLILRLGGSGGEGWSPYEFGGGDSRFIVYPVHYLLVRGWGQGIAQDQSVLSTAFDNYAAALKADPRLDDHLLEPMKAIVATAGVVEYANQVWFGLRFRLRWVVKI